jgi:threonine/homoserine/homoserine lactone efflux protein
MNRSLFITYMLTLTVLMLTPGPDMLFCLASGLKGGPRSGLLAATGAATGEVVHISTAAVGLAAIFRAAPLLFDTCGFLAPPTCCGSASAHSTTVTRPWAKGTRPARAPTAPTWRGLLTNLLNPKVALFTIALLPQFTDPQAGNLAFQFLVLSACFVALEIAVDGTVGILAGRLARLLRARNARRNLNLTAGAIYLGLGAKLALQR